MTVTFDVEQVFWWVALAALVVAAWCVLADTGLGIARLALDLDRQNRASRQQALAKKHQPSPIA
jgi:hypothetical protein